MTVINMMSFGKSGAAVADEQSSAGARKYNSSTKLRLLNDSVIYGGAGAAQFIKEVYDYVKESISEIKNQKKQAVDTELIFQVSKGVISSLKNSAKNKYLMDKFGISFDEFQTGTKQDGIRLDDPFKERAYRSLLEDPFFGSIGAQILLGGLCNDKFEIFYLDTEGGQANKKFLPFASIGSGYDESDKVLSEFYAEMPREKRDRIPVEDGLVKLIEATNASARLNVGVGGIPSIVYFDETGIKEPSENQSILASEIVEGLSRGLLERDFVYDSINQLVLQNADFETVEEQMKTKAKDWKKLDRFLRGYK